MGRAQIPTIGFGPSRESLAHITNEYVEISQLIRAQKGYASIIKSLLRKV
jgi:acetylornithine deacetylase/succinyl-diaminopimelate desuccinylase-like protein